MKQEDSFIQTEIEGSQGKAIMNAIRDDNPKAVAYAMGFDGASFDARVKNRTTTNVYYDATVEVEIDSYGGYPLFIKSSDGERTAIDGARNSFGDLQAGDLNGSLMKYEVGDTALDISVRNGKWLAAAQLIEVQTDHELNEENQGMERTRRRMEPYPFKYESFVEYQEILTLIPTLALTLTLTPIPGGGAEH